MDFSAGTSWFHSDDQSCLEGTLDRAALNHGLFMTPHDMIALSTVMTDAIIDQVVEQAHAAFADVAAEEKRRLTNRTRRHCFEA